MANQLLRSELPKDTLVYLENILAKDPAWLIADDISFLKARLDYLTSDEKRIFASVLEDQKPEPTKKELVAKLLELAPETDEKEANKLNKDQLVAKIAELEAANA